MSRKNGIVLVAVLALLGIMVLSLGACGAAGDGTATPAISEPGTLPDTGSEMTPTLTITDTTGTGTDTGEGTTP